ncbi:MAG: response regulator transcription factor [Gammaproteobacteria bacterium]
MDIALLEDNPSDAWLIESYLQSSDYKCHVFESGQSLIEELPKHKYALLILDWEIPDIAGDKILKWVRAHIGNELPVIFVTGRDATDDVVAMLEAGADDYMTKPVNLKEMLARITALVRRSQTRDRNTDTIDIDPFTLDFNCHRITLSGMEIELTPKEFELAGYLLRNLGDLISRGKLLEEIWGYGPEIHTRTIDIHVSRIRKKLSLNEEHGWKLTSIYHKGYRLERVPMKKEVPAPHPAPE